MQITLDTAKITAEELAGLLALFAAASPEALTLALESLNADGPDVEARVRDGLTAKLTAQTAEPTTFPTPPPAAVVPAAPAPVTTAAPPPPPSPAAATGPQDKNGLFWDPRIHSTSSDGGGTLNGDLSWRAKRGVSADLVTQVTMEQRGAAPVAAAPPPVAPTPVVPPAAPTPSAVPTPPPAAEGADTFVTIMQWISGLQADGSIVPADTIAAVTACGLAALGDLANPANAPLLPTFRATLGALIAAKGA